MDTGKLTELLASIDEVILPQMPQVVQSTTKNFVDIRPIETRLSKPGELDSMIGHKYMTIDIPVEDRPSGISFIVNTELQENFISYLTGEKEGQKMPDALRQALDVAEGYVAKINEFIEVALKKNMVFENPSLSTWEVKDDINLESTMFSKFQVKTNDGLEFELMRIFPVILLRDLAIEEKKAQDDVISPKQSNDEEEGKDYKVDGGNILPIEDLYDLQLEVSAELGRTNISLKKVLDIGLGGIIELNKFAGDPVELYINSKKFAEGEVVVVDQNFAVRITHLISNKEKLKSISSN